ncbi:hypothetical protein FA13DRAFT_1784156 [Coprinellus micaceus]|uniref:Uncharacterized protein n=1 Tax=Coprinellus micaceus TaxID=71717 RepID=A0A4Y7TZF4_COPMI|nr:hypothetical protein FA13DRAFT_1784156 [Coprinellus micaceus]
MPNWGLVDDLSSYISYSSGWARQTGSSRQWDGGVHSTSQVGAAATFRFRGTAIQVYGTVPAGSGTARSRYTIDGGSPIQVNRQSRSSPAYNDLFLDQNGLSAGDHTLTITNLGSDVDFQLDKIEWLPVANDPASETPLGSSAAPPVQSTTSTTSTTTPVQTQPTSGPTTTTTRATTPPSDTTSTIIVTGTETRTEIGTSVQTIVSSFTSDGTPMATTILSTSTLPDESASMSSLSSMMITTTDASGKEGLATVIVVISDGHTTTLDATSTLFTGGRTGAVSSGLSKGALGGIIAGALVLFFMFLFLLVWLLRRVRRRRQLLELDPITSANSQPPMAQTQARGRNANFTPFHLGAQNNTSTQGLISAAGLNRRPMSVHKPALDGPGPDFDDVSDVSSPYSPSSSYSQNANTMYATTSEGGYLQQNFPATLHRRRPTSEFGNTTLATSDAPPPSYQASVGGSGSGLTTEGVARTLVEKS